MHEHKNAYKRVSLKLSSKFKGASLVNLREEVIEDFNDFKGSLSLTFKPFEIKTLLLTL